MAPPLQMINARSCLTCRRRKVRCTRQQPCMYCDKTGSQCVFPETTKKTRQRKPTAREEVQNRLEQLERIVKGILEKRKDANKRENTSRTIDVARAAPDVAIQGSDPNVPTIHQYIGQHLNFQLDEHYANESASNPNQLDQISPQLSGDGILPFPQSSSQVDGWAFKGPSLVVQMSKTAYPLLDWSPILWDVYADHVAPLFPLLHRPTTRSMVLRGIQYSTPTAPEDTALVLAIYFVAVVSMSSTQCDMLLGESRDNAVWYLKGAVKQALSDARFLSNTSLTCMQALVLFLVGMYAENEQRLVWSMTALVVRLAQGMNLHRDGAHLGLAPFDTEIRRRLWWTICLLDVRSCEDNGTEPIINEEMYDVRLPLNVSDDDVYPGMQALPLERTGGTEMTFSLLRFEAIAIVRKVNSTTVSSIEGSKEDSARDYLSEVKKAHQHLNEMYLKHCQFSGVPSRSSLCQQIQQAPICEG
ncbi:fungal-specific transcription factor domain-containing protein [Aspergillus caelatus]|uniref:Fungal-specific transcription factor domain-containing protein n=1 Tax=Aspergillus caelatus TaxID=61420 RepID=A0A5N7AF31_9EURO|nr:fungal-specific transcription factor domain-containing protein [Aspergillus caelatus]KAE8367928.1 fungal-specific transcription factor domain-containing protein [Aspergillus caelatus]